MRILRPIVFSQALLMVAGKSEMPEGSAVGAQFVGRHPGRREALFAEQLAHQLDGRQIGLDDAGPGSRGPRPRGRRHATDTCAGPRSGRPFRRDASDRSVEDDPVAGPSDRRSEFKYPTANTLVGKVEATLGKQLFDIAIAQGEAKVQPHGVLDDDRRKTMPAIGDRSHARSLRRTPPIQQAVFLTVPFVVLPRRWVVERTFSWFGRNRRLAKDFDNLAETLASFVTLASIRLALRRLARA